MATSDMTINVEVRERGRWWMRAAILAVRCVRPKRWAAKLAYWLVNGKYGADIKVDAGKWERGPRAEIEPCGD